MSDQLTFAAACSALALAALCLHAPAVQARGGADGFGAPVAAVAGGHVPAAPLTSLLRR